MTQSSSPTREMRRKNEAWGHSVIYTEITKVLFMDNGVHGLNKVQHMAVGASVNKINLQAQLAHEPDTLHPLVAFLENWHRLPIHKSSLIN